MSGVKLAIIGAEVKAIPAVEGGAVETIVDTFIDQNETDIKHQIDVYSKFNGSAMRKISNMNFAQGYYVKVRPITFWMKAARKLGIRDYRKKYINQVIQKMKGKVYDWIVIENRPEFVLPVRRAFPSAKIGVHVHNTYLTDQTKNAKDILSATNKVITVSDFIANGIRQINQGDAWKVVTLVNRINITKFRPEVKRQDLCEKYDIRPETTTVITHGRIVKEKGILEAIKAVKKASSSVHNLKLIVIGDLNSAKYGYKMLINKEVKDSEMKNMVVFTGYVDHNEIPDYLNLSDMILLPSIWDEPCALTILESLAVGKALISTNTGGTPEIIPEGCGIRVDVDADFVDHLTNKIIFLSRHREIRNSYAKEARRFAVEKLDDRVFFKDFLSKLKGSYANSRV